MAGGQVRVGLVDADRDAERTGAIAALAVGVAGVAVGTGDDPAAADVGARALDAYDVQLDVAVRSCRSAAGNQPGRNGAVVRERAERAVQLSLDCGLLRVCRGCQQRECCTRVHEESTRPPLAHLDLPLRCAYSRPQITLRGGSTTSCWAALGRTR